MAADLAVFLAVGFPLRTRPCASRPTARVMIEIIGGGFNPWRTPGESYCYDDGTFPLPDSWRPWCLFQVSTKSGEDPVANFRHSAPVGDNNCCAIPSNESATPNAPSQSGKKPNRQGMRAAFIRHQPGSLEFHYGSVATPFRLKG